MDFPNSSSGPVQYVRGLVSVNRLAICVCQYRMGSFAVAMWSSDCRLVPVRNWVDSLFSQMVLPASVSDVAARCQLLDDISLSVPYYPVL